MLSRNQFIEINSDEEITNEQMIYVVEGAVHLEWWVWAGIPMLWPGFKYLNDVNLNT